MTTWEPKSTTSGGKTSIRASRGRPSLPAGQKENKDPDFVTGKSRKAGYYDRKTDDRNISKQLEKLKGKWVIKCLI